MAIASADVMKAIVAGWHASGLTPIFNTHWSAANRSEFAVLNNQQAEGAHPFPYCVFELDGGRTANRMTGASSAYLQENRDIPCQFRINTKATDDESALEVAVRLAGEVMAVFGGHPTTAPRMDNYQMDNGHILQFQYQTDYGIREDIENHKWIVMYRILTDVPVRI